MAEALDLTTDLEDEVENEGTAKSELVWVDELPKISRSQEGGVWVERLEPLRDRADTWARVYGPVKNPHPLVNNLKRGNAAGIDPDEFEFAGRTVDGAGFVFARFLSDEARAERDAAEAEGTTDEDEL